MCTVASVACVEENVMVEGGVVVGGRDMLSKRRDKSSAREGVVSCSQSQTVRERCQK